MSDNKVAFLQQQIERLQTAHDRIYKTQGYSHEVERIRILKELVIEQIHVHAEATEDVQIQTRSQSEDTDYSACSLR